MRCMPFISRDTFYKSIFGSIPENSEFVLKVLLPPDGYVKGVVAVFSKDGESETRFEMLPDGYIAENGFYTRSSKISLDEGLYFYYFIMYTIDGERLLLNKGSGVGEFDPENGKDWQLTVYKKNFTTPDFAKGGMIYQIFPDRFFKAKGEYNYPSDRFIRNDWGGMPEFRQPNPPKKLTLGNDYFCGNLNGITEKLPYIKSLGTTIIYLNPIFEAHSNHRYNTANYFKIDPMLGTEKDFINLCKKAKELGIAIILDGVFSHTGDDSVYFNKYKRYNDVGAYNSKHSKYFPWYNFRSYPDDYSCWWGVKSLPEINENNRDYTEFITGENGVLKYWLKKGASGFRLDVADELPDKFLDNVRAAIKAENSDALLIGEVWEDASNKISYGKRRRFIRGNQLDSVMNYPFAGAIIDFLRGGTGFDFCETVTSVCENYPKQVLDVLMNHIGTHDTKRIMTAFAGEQENGRGRLWQSKQSFSKKQLDAGESMLCAAAVLQYTLVGIPSLFYGDEAGLTGYGDPFCRRCFPWGKENKRLTEFYKKLGHARKTCKVFKNGNISFLSLGERQVAFKRFDENGMSFTAVNRNSFDIIVDFGCDISDCTVIFGENPDGSKINVKANGLCLLIKNMR